MQTRRLAGLGTVAALVLTVAASFTITSTIAGTTASSASAATFGSEEITRFDSDITIESDGALLVKETIVYDFGTLQRHGIFRDIPVRVDYPTKKGYDRVYPLDVVSVKGSEGTPDGYTTELDGNNERIKIGDPDRTITGVHTYEITYRMRGVLNGFSDHDELVWERERGRLAGVHPRHACRRARAGGSHPGRLHERSLRLRPSVRGFERRR
jgi:hypothetical protein